MKHSKKVKTGIGFSLFGIAILAFFQSHVIASVTIGISDYNEISPGIYVDSLFTAEDQTLIGIMTQAANDRVSSLYGAVTTTPVMIISSTAERSAKYLSGRLVPGSTYSLPWGQYIPITPQGMNIDVMAHELVHAETFHRLGYLKSLRSLPIWFTEGVAMQVDHRQGKAWSYISQGHDLPPVSSLMTPEQFSSGDRALHYAAAKVEVSSWLSSDSYPGLYQFLSDIRDGANFHQSYYRTGN